MDIDKLVRMNSDYRRTKVEPKDEVYGVKYFIKVTNSTITVRSKYDSFQFEYNWEVRFLNIHEGVQKYSHERMMKKRSAYSRNPLNSQLHRKKLIELIKSKL